MDKLYWAVCAFMYGLSMEEVFIFTGIQILILSFGVVLPIALWVDSKKNKKQLCGAIV